MNLQEIEKLIHKEISGNFSETEQQKLRELTEAYPEYQKLYKDSLKKWNKLTDPGKQLKTNTDEAKSKFILRIKNYKTRRLYYRSAQIAATIVVAVTFASLWFNQTDTGLVLIQNETASNLEHYLPDSSLVVLNKHSEIEYKAEFQERFLHLKGTAYFEVRKKQGQNFQIQTKSSLTEVLGTSFCIEEKSEEHVQIAVLSGKVRFEKARSKEAVLLVKNEQAEITSKEKQITKSEIQDQNFLAWKTERFSFDNESLENILPFLEKHYETKFYLDDSSVAQLSITCKFNQQKLEDVLEELELFLPIRFEQQDNGYTVMKLD